ncbi:LiaF domain-containing protein [Deinococcus maricopensis]|uniref:Cell wall-active antibiotics response LiaF-like C-terminal domain-containing protein n=1 Tax=Deinococcus maricopensis (strain DSM 21211 / LMG 22137 / NRRL B-23946 / LB-34) TaxID=709986 RepID=E8U9X8_DEIML|nr:LiaF domain-containing protein [Deinococcus maricopensis]ADV67867.1 hypothetical protein Deima_2229 [Deinococcus maricopensis DSM 21211]
MRRPLLMTVLAFASLGGAATPYRSVDLTLTQGTGDFTVRAMASASPTLGARTPSVRDGVASVRAVHQVGDWTVGVSPKLPLALTVRHETGTLTLDLRGLTLTAASVNHEVGDLHVTLPSGPLSASIVNGQGNVSITAPATVGVSATVSVTRGHVRVADREVANGLNVTGTYRTPNYATSKHHVKLSIVVNEGDVDLR